MPIKTVRLNKLIADSGYCSRRAADQLIENGHVTVNGKKVFELGVKVLPNKDQIKINNQPLRAKPTHIYIMLNKPRGILTTMEDPLERPTIKELIESEVPYRVFPVGRLDWDSEGLLLLTNDGNYANRIMQPNSEVTKTYLVKVNGHPTDEKLAKLKKGVTIVGGKVSALHIERIKRGADQYDWIKIVITEGKNRQIRQMFEKIGFDVMKLQRVAIGSLRLGALDRGQLVYLNETAAQRVFTPDIQSGKDRYKKTQQKSKKRIQK